MTRQTEAQQAGSFKLSPGRGHRLPLACLAWDNWDLAHMITLPPNTGGAEGVVQDAVETALSCWPQVFNPYCSTAQACSSPRGPVTPSGLQEGERSVRTGLCPGLASLPGDPAAGWPIARCRAIGSTCSQLCRDVSLQLGLQHDWFSGLALPGSRSAVTSMGIPPPAPPLQQPLPCLGLDLPALAGQGEPASAFRYKS